MSLAFWPGGKTLILYDCRKGRETNKGAIGIFPFSFGTQKTIKRPLSKFGWSLTLKHNPHNEDASPTFSICVCVWLCVWLCWWRVGDGRRRHTRSFYWNIQKFEKAASISLWLLSPLPGISPPPSPLKPKSHLFYRKVNQCICNYCMCLILWKTWVLSSPVVVKVWRPWGFYSASCCRL